MLTLPSLQILAQLRPAATEVADVECQRDFPTYDLSLILVNAKRRTFLQTLAFPELLAARMRDPRIFVLSLTNSISYICNGGPPQ